MNDIGLVTKKSPDRSVVAVGNVRFGEGLVIIAGPCSVESEEQTMEIARAVQAAGADMIRGGVFKPRTSPYAFQGMKEEGLILLAKARELTGLPIITEVVNPETVRQRVF